MSGSLVRHFFRRSLPCPRFSLASGQRRRGPSYPRHVALAKRESTTLAAAVIGLRDSYTNPKDYYDTWASTYSSTVERWGYTAPQEVVNVLASTVPLRRSTLRVLDCGAGDGLVGLALAEHGFSDVTAVDISERMLEIAQERGCYKDLVNGDIRDMPFEEGEFDVLICVAGTSYVSAESVLPEFLRVVRPGGLIGFSHKAGTWPEYVPLQESLVTEGAWKGVYEGDEQEYLPNFDEGDGEELGVMTMKIWFYQKCAEAAPDAAGGPN